MSKSDNGALVGQIIKGAVGLVGTIVVGIFSVKKGKKEYNNWKGNRK